MFKCLFASNKKSKRDKSTARELPSVETKVHPKISIQTINISSKLSRDTGLDSTRSRSALADTRTSVRSPTSCFSTMAARLEEVEELPVDNKMIDDHLNHLLKQQRIWTIMDPLHNHEVSHKMRAKIVDWMGQVVFQYKLSIQTFFLAVAYLDTYLFKEKTPQKPIDLSLTGLACLFMASKFEDIEYLKMQTVVDKLGNQQFSADQIAKREREILFQFGFNITIPTIYEFIVNYVGRITKDCTAEEQKLVIDGALYFAKLTTYHPSLSTMKRSKLASALSFVALKKLASLKKSALPEDWKETFWSITSELKDEILNVVLEVESLKADTSETYSKLKMHRETTSSEVFAAMK